MRPIKKIKKAAAIILLAATLFPLQANLRLHRIVQYNKDMRNNTVTNEVLDYLEAHTNIRLRRQVLVAQVFQNCETMISMDEEPEPLLPENFVYTLPYLTDDVVLVTRIGEDIEIKKEINDGNNSRIYAGYEHDDIFRQWLAESNFDNITDMSETLEDSFNMIIAGTADFTILPHQMATTIISDASLGSQLTTSRVLFPVEYRLPIEKDDVETLVRINDELFKMEQDGTLLDIYYRKGVKSNIVIEQESKLLKPIMLTVFLLFFCILSIVYFIRYFTVYKNTKNKKNNNNIMEEDVFSNNINEKITLLTQKNITLSEQITENKNTDPYTGFFNMSYLRQKINDSFVLYAKRGIPFSIAIIDTFKRNDSLTESLGTMKEEISHLNKLGDLDIIPVHNGFGIFYILFPSTSQNDALKIIKQAGCCFQNFSLLEYKGQDQYEFLGGLGIW